MKKLILAVALACASLCAHANQFAIQLGQVPAQVDAQSVVMALVKAGIPAFAETKDGKVLLRAGPFATHEQAQAELPKITAVFAKIMADPSSVRVAPASAPATDESSNKAVDMVAVAKQMDSEWQIYVPARSECETLTVFFGRIVGHDMGIRTPEQFAAYYGNGATVHYGAYGQGGKAAEIDEGAGKYMLAHGTEACNEIAAVIQSQD